MPSPSISAAFGLGEMVRFRNGVTASVRSYPVQGGDCGIFHVKERDTKRPCLFGTGQRFKEALKGSSWDN